MARDIRRSCAAAGVFATINSAVQNEVDLLLSSAQSEGSDFLFCRIECVVGAHIYALDCILLLY
jgi:hypothetical protein